jgi:ABC-type tungstate transport system permease subunit
MMENPKTILYVLPSLCLDRTGLTLSLEIDWVTGDTTESINYLATGDADIAITYNAAAENRAMKLSVATKRVYGFRDHFYLVGPK